MKRRRPKLLLALICVEHDLNGSAPSAGKQSMAENFDSRREPRDSSRVLGKPKVAAWAIVMVLVLIVFIGFGTLRGRAHTSADDGAGIVNPTHEARCPELRALDRCQVQRPREPEERPDPT